jgi:hypothetical protein
LDLLPNWFAECTALLSLDPVRREDTEAVMRTIYIALPAMLKKMTELLE